MKTSVKNARLFDKAFMFQIFRLLLPLGVTFAAIELLQSLNIFTLSASFFYEVGLDRSGYTGLLPLYLMLAGYRAARIMRSNEAALYGCIPIAKRTMWGSSLVAALLWGGIILLAHIVGYCLTWFVIIGSSVRFGIVPPSYYIHILSLLRAILSGLFAYGMANLLTSVTGGFWSAFAAGVALVLCLQFGGSMLKMLSGSDFTPIALLLPVGKRVLTLLSWLLNAVTAAGALTAAYFAFVRSRVETIRMPAGSVKLHIAICSVWALAAAFYASQLFMVQRYNAEDFGTTLIYSALLPLLIGALFYALYMILCVRSFKIGIKMLVYYPVVVGSFTLVMLSAYGLKHLDHGVVISTDTLDCVMVPGHIVGQGSYDGFYSYGDSFGMFYDATTAIADVGSEQYYELRDPKLLRDIAIAYANGNLGSATSSYSSGLSPIGQLFFGGWRGDGLPDITIRLKDGRQYTMRLHSYYEYGQNVMQDIMADQGYITELTDVTRFEGGHIATPTNLDRGNLDAEIGRKLLMDTLMEELAALTTEQRAELFMLKSGEQSAFRYTIGTVIIASPMNRYMQSVMLTDLTPRSTDLYMRLCNANSEKTGAKAKLIEALTQSEGIEEATMFIAGRDGTFLSSESYYYFNSEPDKISVPERQRDLLVDVLSNSISPGDAEYIMYIRDVWVYGKSDIISYLGELNLYVGITAEQLERLRELFVLIDPDNPEIVSPEDFPAETI